jgi:hypothetical protein
VNHPAVREFCFLLIAIETSIRAYAKFVDVAAKVTVTQQDEQDMVRQERRAIDEIRGLLAESTADRVISDACGS